MDANISARRRQIEQDDRVQAVTIDWDTDDARAVFEALVEDDASGFIEELNASDQFEIQRTMYVGFGTEVVLR
jgi:hypothetical protein